MSYFSAIKNSQLDPDFLNYVHHFDKYLRNDLGLKGQTLIDMLYSSPLSEIDIIDFIYDHPDDFARALHMALMYEFDSQIGISQKDCPSNIIEDLFMDSDAYNQNQYTGYANSHVLANHGFLSLTSNLFVRDEKIKLAIARVKYRTLQYYESSISIEDGKIEFTDLADMSAYLCAHARSSINQSGDFFRCESIKTLDVPPSLLKMASHEFIQLGAAEKSLIIDGAFAEIKANDPDGYSGGSLSDLHKMALAVRWPIEYIRSEIAIGADAKTAVEQARELSEIILLKTLLPHHEISDKLDHIGMLALMPYPEIFKDNFSHNRLPLSVAMNTLKKSDINEQGFPYYSGFGADDISSRLGLTEDLIGLMIESYGYNKEEIVSEFSKMEPSLNAIKQLSSKKNHFNEVDIDNIILDSLSMISSKAAWSQLGDLLKIGDQVRFLESDSVKMAYNKAIIDYASVNPNYAKDRPMPSMAFSETIGKDDIIQHIAENKIKISREVMRSAGFTPKDIGKMWSSIEPEVKSKTIQSDLGM